MKNGWIRFGCFLTGYNYALVKSASEASAKTVKRYTSAMVIVSVLWAFIGYVFTERYLKGNTITCLLGSAMMILLIIQIERQILLSISPNKGLYFIRSLIGVLMAIIGSLILDQLIFSQDIDLEKIPYIQEKVQTLLPVATGELRSQINYEIQEIKKLETERKEDLKEVSEKPFFKEVSTQSLPQKVTQFHIDQSGKEISIERLVHSHSISTVSIPNPKQSQIPEIDKTLENLNKDKMGKERRLLNIQEDLENRLKTKSGFLEDLSLLFRIFSRSSLAMGVWVVWFLFLLGLELLVLISKLTDLKTDYDEAIFSQMEMKKNRILTLTSVSRIECSKKF